MGKECSRRRKSLCKRLEVSVRDGTGDGSEWMGSVAVEKVDLVIQELYWRVREGGLSRGDSCLLWAARFLQ